MIDQKLTDILKPLFIKARNGEFVTPLIVQARNQIKALVRESFGEKGKWVGRKELNKKWGEK